MNDWKNVLVAVNNTPTSKQALQYAADILGNLPATRIGLLYIYPEPPPDYYRSGKSLDTYKEEKEEAASRFLELAVRELEQAGIEQGSISIMYRLADHATISQAILDVATEGKYGTIVVGKRGVSKAEEFLFGSISSALVHHSHECTVWVVG